MLTWYNHRPSYKRYFPPNVEIKHDNVLIYAQNLFDQPAKIHLETSDNI